LREAANLDARAVERADFDVVALDEFQVAPEFWREPDVGAAAMRGEFLDARHGRESSTIQSIQSGVGGPEYLAL
jgi:hypothetical protein